MKTFQSAWRKFKRIIIYAWALFFSVVVRRKIAIREAGTSGIDNFWQTSFQVTVSLPGKRMHLEILRAAPKKDKFHKVASAIRIAEDICIEHFLPATPVFIEVDKDIIVVTIKEN